MDPNENNEPVAPVEPVVEPVAPVVDPPADEADAEENKEWDDAAKELFPGLKSGKKKDANKEDSEDEPTDGGEKPKTPKAAGKGKVDPNETPEQKAEREAKEAADAQELEEEDEAPDTTARDNRLATREYQQQVAAVKQDIRAKMFADVPTELRDKDGDPIRTIDDVTKLINPRTGEAFTDEEAGMWLLSAQQQFNQTLAAVEAQIEQVAEVNLDLKDQADLIRYQYGELLKAMPDLRDELWADYEATLVKDPASGLILRAPINLERYYARNLKPYAEKALQLEQEAAGGGTPPAPVKPAVDPAAAKAAAEAEKARKRADRSDIYGGGDNKNEDPEDKEWNDAAVAVFGPRK